jgi:hypothetical protein
VPAGAERSEFASGQPGDPLAKDPVVASGMQLPWPPTPMGGHTMSTVETKVDKNVSKLEEQLNLWAAKLNEVAAKAGVVSQQAKIDSRKQLDELKIKLESARLKLDEAKAAGGEKWEIFRQGVEHAWQELEGAFKKLIH